MAGSVYKRGKTWTFVIDTIPDENSRRRQSSRGGFKTKREAEAEKSRLLTQRDQGIDVSVDRMTVREYLTSWLLNHVQAKVAPSTYLGYHQLVRLHINPVIGHILLGRLTPLQIDAVYAAVLQKGRSARTALQVHRCLHSALAQAVKYQFVPRNSAAAAAPPRPPKYEARTVTSLEELSRLLTAADSTSYGVLVRLALETGAREGELLALHWRDVDLNAGLIHVRGTARRQPGKGIVFGPPKTRSSARTLDINSSTIAMLQNHHSKQLEQRLLAGIEYNYQELVFATAFGNPIDAANLERAWRKIVAKAELMGFRFHDLRHTNASWLLASGERIEVVSQRLGHSGIAITIDTYGHMLPGAGKAAAAKMAAILDTATRGVSDPLANARDS